MISTWQKGLLAESIVKDFLIKKGHIYIDSNVYTSPGEIDLITQDNDFIVFTEVKSISKKSEISIYETLSQIKKKHLKGSINRWLLKNNSQEKPWRVDFIGITSDGTNHEIFHQEFIGL